MLVNRPVADGLHHGEMLQIVMRLKQSVACEKFDKYTTDAPDVAWITPSEVEDDFWCAVVPCRYDGRVILVVESRRSKVDQPNLWFKQDFAVLSRASGRRGRGRYVAVICKGLVCTVDEQYVFRLQIRVDEIQIVEDCEVNISHTFLMWSIARRELSTYKQRW